MSIFWDYIYKISTGDEVDLEKKVKLIFDEKFQAEITASFSRDIGNSTRINGKNGKILITNTWNSDEGEIILINEEKKNFKIKNEKNIYSIEIDEISNDILNNKNEASFPGTNKKDILIVSCHRNIFLHIILFLKYGANNIVFKSHL